MPKAKYNKRADGRYCSQIRTGEYRPNGKEIIKTYYGRTVAELDAKLREARRQQETGIFIDDKGLTVHEWAKEWLSAYKSQGEPSTQQMYKGAVHTHIIPAIGRMRLRDVRNHHLQHLLSNMAAEEYSLHMVKIVKMTLQQLFRQARKNQLIPFDHAEDLVANGVQPVERDALNPAERAAVLEAANEHDLGIFVKLCYYCGLRRGEALGLSRSDIDADKRMLQIRRQLAFVNNKGVLKDKLKTRAGRRDLPIPDEFFDELFSFSRSRPSLYLFADENGSFITFDAFKWAWQTIVSIANTKLGGTDEVNALPSLTPHVLRHTYATILYELGVDVKTAQKYLGHDDPMVTMKIYTHLSEKKQSESDAKVRAFTSLSQSNVSQNEMLAAAKNPQ